MNDQEPQEQEQDPKDCRGTHTYSGLHEPLVRLDGSVWCLVCKKIMKRADEK